MYAERRKSERRNFSVTTQSIKNYRTLVMGRLVRSIMICDNDKFRDRNHEIIPWSISLLRFDRHNISEIFVTAYLVTT